MTPILLEVCVAGVEDALLAEASGADRFELNSALELGGLTPSLGLCQEVLQRVRLPVIGLLRPRPAGFHYTAAERSVVLRDAERLLEQGVAGLAFGTLTETRFPDAEFCRQVVRLAAGKQTVFHRAYDCVTNPQDALECLIDCGVTRVLSSGGAPTAWEGRLELRQLQDQAAGRIEILPASGIGPDNVLELLHATGCQQIHGTFRAAASDPAHPVADDRYWRTCPTTVGRIRQLLHEAAQL